MSNIGNLGRILDGKFERFCRANNLEKNGLGFERFVNNIILTSFQPNAFVDTELFDFICVGGDNDLGIDGLGILVNGRLVKSKQDIDDILNFSSLIKVDIVFIQSKYREDGVSKDFFNNFAFGVRDFLSEEIRSPINRAIQDFFDLKEYLFSIDVSERLEKNPTVWLYFAAFTDRSASQHVIAIKDQLVDDINSLNSYEIPIVKILDVKGLKDICDQNENQLKVTIKVKHVLPLSFVDNVDNSAVFSCYADEYMKILGGEEDLIRKTLFEDNVRDFQGLSSINNEIQVTLKENPESFALLNNGITIVCDGYDQRNDFVTIKNPQIINGCQTSHILFNNRNSIALSKLPLVVKIIATTDSDIVNKIVRAANRQNIVYEEAFETTREFHKTLEQFFLSMSIGDDKVYYERRAKQYLNNPQVKVNQKFGIKIVTQSYVGMFLEQVHQTHRHETVLIKEFQGKIFNDDQSFYPYYTATAAYYKLESFIRLESIDLREFLVYRYHILLASKWAFYKKIKFKGDVFSDEFCVAYVKNLSNTELSLLLFKEALEVMRKAKDKWINELGRSKYAIKDNKEFTAHLLNMIREDGEGGVLGNINFGQVNRIRQHDANRLYYGFINYGNSSSVYFDETSMAEGVCISQLLRFQRVSFEVETLINGKTIARKVTLV